MGKVIYRYMLLLALCLPFAQSAMAKDSDRALELLKNGEILSLTEILQLVGSKVHGKLVEVELEEKHGKVVYDIDFLAENGVVMEMLVHPKTGEILSLEED
ncbi:MAG: hypothetical protein AUK35_00040 [Zetaproteobacteria bacterium CG2_30_46_52]|nr:MAG: hypothetical protein AUK35_00040 [Zetaproteobacteria bacterium CG2_30_46_52]